MKRGIIIVIGLIVAVGAIVAVVFALQNQNNSAANQDQSNQSNNSQTNEESFTADPGQLTTDKVAIKGSAFTPQKVVVKKGTTVTWTNEDSIGHNVIAMDAQNSGGLPTSAALLQQGESFSHTFNDLGNFPYRCGPHPNMRGSVEVVEVAQ